MNHLLTPSRNLKRNPIKIRPATVSNKEGKALTSANAARSDARPKDPPTRPKTAGRRGISKV
jgi:hypothetical protein